MLSLKIVISDNNLYTNVWIVCKVFVLISELLLLLLMLYIISLYDNIFYRYSVKIIHLTVNIKEILIPNVVWRNIIIMKFIVSKYDNYEVILHCKILQRHICHYLILNIFFFRE